ncbi:NUDIX hydrolase [Halococcus salsus]|uniref:NUDIX hydrolase n=1 Tax=Halococcus salsus TaxID=2162894 RepID=UPI0013571AB1|nr:NUDIX domain-containing protein [Halococcus salsus]
METTRHFTATVYLVNDGAVALHHHPKLGIRIPPGGHVDRDELPHETAVREVREETGYKVDLLGDAPAVDAPDGRALPTPRYQLCYDIDVGPEGVYHQHIDQVYFARAPHREIAPAGDDEPGPEAWDWYTSTDLDAEAGSDSLGRDTVRIAKEALAAAERAD